MDMPQFLRPYAFAAAGLVLSGVLPGCGTVDGASNRIVNAITPYRIEIVQGNFVSKEQVAALQAGMSRLQVRDLLGTPLMTSIFRGERWDYVFTIKRSGVDPQARRLTLLFKDDLLSSFQSDEMPTEAEFVATLDTRRRASGKVPQMEASEESLKRFSVRNAPVADESKATGEAPAPTAYPPLESTAGR